MKKTEFKEYFNLAIRNLKSRSLRSWLTIFGIVIGVFLIISLFSLSEGMKQSIVQRLKSLGSEIIFIMPGDVSNLMVMFSSSVRLEKEDIQAIEKTRGVEEILTTSYQYMAARYENEGGTVFLSGLSWEKGIDIMQRFQGWSLREGRWPIAGRREIIIGREVENGIFKRPVEVGNEIIIKGRRFKVVGILNSLGGKQEDSSVYIDLAMFQSLTGEKKGTAQVVMARVDSDKYDVDKVAESIKDKLLETRKKRIGTDSADFSVVTSEKMEDIAGSILAVIQFAVIAFASIAVVVGGIGIMNTMFTSVRERTREIGIMKAIGAKNSAVLAIFLIEAGVIGLIGGFGGIILGTILAKSIEVYIKSNSLFAFKALVTPGLIVFGLVFSFLIGCLSGFFPARAAAKLKPVDALRKYE